MTKNKTYKEFAGVCGQTPLTKRFPNLESLSELARLRFIVKRERAGKECWKAETARAKHRADHDPLTGLPLTHILENFYAHYQAEMRRAHFKGETIKGGVICFLDGDGFGQVNKIFDTETGDTVIRALGDSAKRHIRATDSVFRRGKGADEFILYIPDVSQDEAHDLIFGKNGILERINRDTFIPVKHPVDNSDTVLQIQVSMGYAHFGLGDKLDDVLNQADKHMQRQKKAKKAVREMDGHGPLHLILPTPAVA